MPLTEQSQEIVMQERNSSILDQDVVNNSIISLGTDGMNSSLQNMIQAKSSQVKSGDRPSSASHPDKLN